MSENIETKEEAEETLAPQESAEFKNLLTLGRLTVTDDLAGHPVTIRTLTMDEDLAVGMVIKPYIGTDSYTRAYKTAMVAASVRDIDGLPVYTSIQDEQTLEVITKKFNIIKSKYYPLVIDELYKKFITLEEQLIPVVSRLGKKLS